MRTPSYTRMPLVGPRSRYLLLHEVPTWVYHRMAAGSAMTGVAPETATTDASQTDPIVDSGVATYGNLTKGGLFTQLYNYKKPMIVEAVDTANTVVVKAVSPATSTERTIDATKTPFKVAANEVLKITCVTAGSSVGILVREDIPSR